MTQLPKRRTAFGLLATATPIDVEQRGDWRDASPMLGHRRRISLAAQVHTIRVEYDVHVLSGRCSSSFLWLLVWCGRWERTSRCPKVSVQSESW